jgi:hypothetical protein
MGKHGNKYQVNLKITKFSQDLYAFSMNRSVCMLKNVHINFTVVKEHRNLIRICVVILRLKTLF